MEKSRFFAYSWHIDEDEEDITCLRIYGIGEDDKNICLRVDDFTPYVYIELPDRINWTAAAAQKLGNKIDELMGNQRPLKKKLMWKKKLYGAHLDKDMKTRKLFPYLFCNFSTVNDIKSLGFRLRSMLHIAGLGALKLQIHEAKADPILQLTCCRRIPTAGWIEFHGKRIDDDYKVTLCDEEWKVKYKHLFPYESNRIARPKILSFDIEVNSSNPSTMPKPDRAGDKVFQISGVIARYSDHVDEYEKFLLTLGQPDPEVVGDDVLIYMYNTEAALLEGFTEFIREENPNLIAGYNILGFDIDYMLKRAKWNVCDAKFDRMGFHKFAHSKEKVIKWSSSAYKNQEFQYLDAEGRVFIDLLPLVRRDFKMSNYKLKTISTHFIGVTKDPLTVKGIFKCYRIGIRKNDDGTYSNKAQRAMAIIGKYCVQDSILVLQLMDKLQTWVGLTEMANTCGVSIFTLYTQGQQVKVYSQLYEYCMFENIVVEQDAYKVMANERYVGAHVFPPVPGRYNNVVPFDFASLYPTTIIAYNIDYHTWVPDDSDIPDEMCHVMEWEDHLGCIMKGTTVTMGEYSMKIENLEDYQDNLLAYNEEKQGMSYYQQTNFFNQGVKECLKLTMEDGTELCCTPDHRILLSNNTWVEAKDVRIDQDRVSTSYSPPVFDVKDKELVVNNFHFTGSRLIKFYKILGVLCSDEYMTHNRTKVFLVHPIDLKNMVRDLEDLQEGSTSVRKENYGWGITILGKLGEMFRNLDGVLWDAKVDQTRTLPNLLEQASQGELCAFMSGLFGGDGHTFSYSEKAQSLGTIGFSWTSGKPEQLIPVFSQLQKYLSVCGINTSTKRLKDQTYLCIKTSDILKFKERIGLSYCVHKSMRLEVGYSYLKLRNEVWNQQKWLVSRVKTLKNTMTVEEATSRATIELRTNFPIYNEYYASPSLSQMKELLRLRKKWEKPMFSYQYFPTVPEYMKSIGAANLFDSYADYISDDVLPRLYKKIIKIESIGKKQVYDLEVSTSHSFVASGVVVHNCAHDPKVIRKVELTEYINNEEKKIKAVREKKNALRISTVMTKYKCDRQSASKYLKKEKDDYKIQIDTMVNELKPYKKERSDLNKTKPKFPMCEKRYYRFLKEPRGVLPTVIQNLLDARAHTRKVDQKNVLAQIDELKKKGGHEEEIKELQGLFGVLDKRQLAYKVSANSMYGAMGVRRGMLPFMPGAMCTTYMGRVNIEKVAETIVKKYEGQLVYGDTDCLIGDTPVLLKWIDPEEPLRVKLCYKTMETISAGNWTRINPNKEISDPLPGYQIWSDKGFTDIVNVVRCGVIKPLSRVVVHVGEVTCSNEHSLLREDLTSATPLDIKIKDPLCISELPLPGDTPIEPLYPNNLTSDVIQKYEISPDVLKDGFSAELAFVWGVFFADGSCGTYTQKNKYLLHTWVIIKKDKTLLQRCMNILKQHESTMNFKILDTVKSSCVYKLVAVQHSRKIDHKGNIKNFVETYRDLFYDKRKYKKVPDIILNLPLSFREAFFMGYYTGDGSKKDPALSITNKGAIGSAGLFFLLRSLGYKVSINTRHDKPDIYKLTGSLHKQDFRYKPNNVKKIIPVIREEHQYIYDIETANHHFAAGVGQLVVHNSSYIYFPHIQDKPAKDLWDYSVYVAKEVSKLFPPPINN